MFERLHEQGRRESRLFLAYRPIYYVQRWVFGRDGIPWDFLRDRLIPLHPDKCTLAYVLCRSLNAQRVVEFGTSFGVLTIYLAAAVRENGHTGSRGVVIGTEIEPTKVIAARENLAEAGLADFVEIREGDPTETLKDIGGAADFLLMDSWTDYARSIIEVMAPQLRLGAIVMADNVPRTPRRYRDYVEYVRDPSNGFRSVWWPYEGGVELSVRVPL